MKSYERFLTALKRGIPDKVPAWELIIDEPVLSSVLHKKPTKTPEEKLERYCELIEFLDMDGVTWPEDQILKQSQEGFVDEWGITWKPNFSGILYPVKGPLNDLDSIDEKLRNYSPPDPDAPHRLISLEKIIDGFEGERAIVFLGHEAFEFSHYLLRGMNNLFKLYYFKPDQALQLAEMISEYKLRVMERAIKLGANAVVCGDDYADNKGPFIPPKHFDTFILPYIRKAVNLVHRMGSFYIKHTDGKLDFMLDMLVNAGIDALHPIEPAAGMSIAHIKQLYDNRICLVGNIDCRRLLTEGTPNDVIEVVKETIVKAAINGGYILSSSNSIHPGVKPENFIAMVNAVKQYGKYPIDNALIEEYSKRNYYRTLYPRLF